MSKLKIYKASAGSGKTFRLALEYLKIALAGEWNYKNILAVTFTNKATTEMKERVIEELYVLAQEQPSAYLPLLVQEMGLPEVVLAERARKSLKRILHDYSRFSISTIDSFFQRVIKSFNRELGINVAYQVDLEDNLILEEAVDELLLSIEENPELLEWLKKFANEKIREGGGWNLKNDILKLGSQIYNETFKALNQTLYEKINDKAFINAYKKELNAVIHQFENNLKRIGKAGLNVMEQRGLSVDDFKYKKSGAAASFQRLADLNLDKWPAKRALKASEELDEWTGKKDPAPVVEAAAALQALLLEAITFFYQKLHEYNSAKLIVSQLYTLGILVDLQAMVRRVTQEKGVVLISDSGSLLKSIIDDSDAPFIYEKTGVFYNHFMIDEFQDTSGLQWGNFQPLIANALAEDHLGMVVGDVKQAIYRWRNGDWNLLASEVNNQFPANGTEEETLQKNWRSTGNIIRFNNSIFQILPQLFQQHINAELAENRLEDQEMESQIESIYGQSLQEIANTRLENDGAIRMRFLENGKDVDPEELRAQILDELVASIKEVQDRGASAHEIAVLVRTKGDAKEIADRLLKEKDAETKYNFNILSSESLYVKNSAAVSLVLALLQLLADPNDKVALALANHLYYNELFDSLDALGKVPSLTVPKSDQMAISFESFDKPKETSLFEKLTDQNNNLSDFLLSDYFTETLSGRNIQEISLKICELFNLFELQDELAYLQAFIDQLAAFMKSRTTDISAFLIWWEEQGQKKTIAVSEELDAIRIQTIHKAKGLEYNYVFIPFCDWKMDVSPQHAPILWCQPKLPPFDQLELVPVKFGKDMGESIFFREYFQEKISNYIDNLNLLYVAFTRARTALFTWSVTSGKFTTMADALLQSLEKADHFALQGEESLFCDLLASYDSEEKTFELGSFQFPKSSKETKKDHCLVLDKFRFADFHSYLKLRKRNEHFFVEDELASTKVNKGRIFHEVLAQIATHEDVEAAVKDLVFRGVIQQAEGEAMKMQIHELIIAPEVTAWFNGSYRVLNERSVITGANGVKRPDRIMLNDDELIVVDYKSGEKELEKYHYQVGNYMKELRKCGYPNVTGYIWYTHLNKRVKVEGH